MTDIDGYMRPCEACGGTGIQANEGYTVPCSVCNGTGIHYDDDDEPELLAPSDDWNVPSYPGDNDYDPDHPENMSEDEYRDWLHRSGAL